MDNFSDKDWELFFSCGENKSKRAYSPKAKAANATENEDEKIIINVNAINDDRPRVITQRQIAEVKGFRTRRHSGAVATKK